MKTFKIVGGSKGIYVLQANNMDAVLNLWKLAFGCLPKSIELIN